MPKNLVKCVLEVPDLSPKADRQKSEIVKNRENTTMLHYLAGDNFDLTRKVVEFFTLKILT